MDLRPISENQKAEYNRLVTHVIQSWEWGEFREKTGVTLLRYGIFTNNKLTTAFQITLHKIPLTSQFVGYLPKGPELTRDLSDALEQIGKQHHCAFIKVEPNIQAKTEPYTIYPTFQPSPKPYFTKYNFIIDLTQSEAELLQNAHQKTRYNIRVAEKKGVTVEERTDDEAFKIYLKLYFETTRRQGYFGHDEAYHRKAWETLRENNMARLLIGFYDGVPLSCWMLVNFKDTLYYPYGGSSLEHREVMANNLVAWEAIKLGKRLHLKKFDMWGALSPDPDPTHPHYGFHHFKQGYGGELVEYVGTYDLIFNDTLYSLFTQIDKFTKLKALLLKAAGR